MALQSAHGGYVKIASATALAVERWSANWRVRDAEVTQSDSGGSTLYMSVCEDNDWEYSCARDDTTFPETAGFAPGTIIATLFFKLGAGAKADKLVNTLVTDVSPVVDNKGDVVRVTVRGKGGNVTADQSIT